MNAPRGQGQFVQIRAAKIGQVLWFEQTEANLASITIRAGKLITQTACWAVEIRSGKTHKITRLEITGERATDGPESIGMVP